MTAGLVQTAVISSRGADRILAGHPWVYRSDVVRVSAEPGDLVRVVNERERPLGWALFSSSSQIAIRMIEGPQPSLDERALFTSRLRAAIDYRASLEIDATACRLVHGEADRLPALIVDKYGDAGGGEYLVVQTLCQGMDRRRELVVELLSSIVAPRGILARNDPRVRSLEGLDRSVEVWAGEVPERIDVREGASRLRVDVRHGQKTGLFLDQRENHREAARYARGRVLDAFAYHGGFTLAMARRADSVVALDSSEAAVAATREHAKLNGLANVEARATNVFDELRELEIAGDRFDTIVLDPPAFAKNRSSVSRALAGYKEINLRAMKLLQPGGCLITCSCSYNVDETAFLNVLAEAAIDARAPMVLVEKRQQAADHPVLLTVPETLYLKCVILRRAD